MTAYVGGDWPRTSERVTDLGVVSPNEAAAYFFALVPTIERGEKHGRLLLPAVLADDPGAVPRLIALANDGSAAPGTHAGRRFSGWDCSATPRSFPCSSRSREEEGPDRRDRTSIEDTEAPGKKGLGTSAPGRAQHAGERSPEFRH